MNRIVAFAMLAFSASVLAQTLSLSSGSSVYIEPMHGYETYLAAAIIKKHVPLIVVGNREQAAFIVQSTISHTQPSQPAIVVNNSNTIGNNGSNDAWNQGWESGRERAAQRAALGSSSASISIVDAHSSQVVFAFAAAKMGSKQIQNTAEDCAKHLKEFIEKSEKTKK
jgi:hypothetical protein